jgi:hypothetical protein
LVAVVLGLLLSVAGPASADFIPFSGSGFFGHDFHATRQR